MSLPKSTENPREFSSVVRAILQARGWSQNKLASEISVDPSNVSLWLNGQRVADQFSCLLLAGLAATSDDRDYLVSLKITEQQLALVLHGLSPVAHTDQDSTEIRRRLAAFRDFMERASPKAIDSIMYLVNSVS